MSSRKSFEILFRKKIPYWSNFLMALMIPLFAILFLLYLMMSPSDKSPDEMKVAYFILAIPEWLKQSAAYSFIGLLILVPIYVKSRLLKSGLLVIEDSNFIINGANMDQIIPVDSISKIYIDDIKRYFRRPHEALEVVIHHKSHNPTSFLLKYYIQTEELLEALSSFDKIGFEFYKFGLVAHDDGEI